MMGDTTISTDATSTQPRIWSRYLVANMHCPSCVSHIEEVLNALHPRPYRVAPSLVTSWVAAEHDALLSRRTIWEALDRAGFEVCDAIPESDWYPSGSPQPQEDTGYLDRALEKLRGSKFKPGVAQTQEHIDRCEVCREARDEKHGNQQGPSAPNTVSKEKREDLESANPQQKGMDPKLESLVVIDSAESQDRWRASLAIGGMTCASCVAAIIEKLKEKQWVDKVAVNLISNSATVEFNGEQHKNDIVESIEDIGYDATIDSVLNLSAASDTEGDERVREIDILINGMFCEHCPSRIVTALEQLDSPVSIDKPPSIQDPVLKIKYAPQAPKFTIRTILANISAVDAVFEPSIYHPPTLEERSHKIHAREQQRILIRILLTIVVAFPTLIIGIIFMSLAPSSNPTRQFFMHPLHAGVSRAQWALFTMATPVYFLCADVFHKRALKELRSMWRPGSSTPFLQRFYRFGSMNMLMSLGTSIAYFSSVAQLIDAGVHPSSNPNNRSFYFDSVVFLTLFLLVGRLIESYSKSRAGDAVTMLGKLRPSEALLVEGSTEDSSNDSGDIGVKKKVGESLKTLKVDLLEFGDTVKVLHGGSPPCDGTIVKGETKFDESSLTGESKLIKKAVGDKVFSGTANKEAPISIKITGVAGSSMLDQIVKAVREGQTHRAPMERIADTLTGYFVPFVTLVAVLTWVIWLALGYSGALPAEYLGSETRGWAAWSIEFAIAVFVAACPCGLALAAPTALFVGGGIAAQNGILVKGGGEAFERASQLDYVLFDKTGTLTVGGEPVVTDFQSFPIKRKTEEEDHEAKSPSDVVSDEKTILGMVSALESNSSHMVAKAITCFCRSKEVNNIDTGHIEEVPGKGMRGTFQLQSNESVELIIGNEMLLKEVLDHFDTHEAQAILEDWKSAGKSIAIAAAQYTSNAEKPVQSEWQVVAIFGISDPIRPEAVAIVAALQNRGTDVWMLSGDNKLTASTIGRQVGIHSDNIIADVLPSEKADKIKYLQRTLKARTGHKGEEHAHKRALIAMIGDGINDSPALTAADVGIAIGSGSDIAISSAEFVLVSSNLNALITLLDLSKVVFRRIKFNFAWALVYNLVALPVAAGVLYPVVSAGKHIRLDPVWASLAMALSSISVVCSSLALRSRVPGVGFRVRESVRGEGMRW